MFTNAAISISTALNGAAAVRLKSLLESGKTGVIAETFEDGEVWEYDGHVLQVSAARGRLVRFMFQLESVRYRVPKSKRRRPVATIRPGDLVKLVDGVIPRFGKDFEL